MFKVNNKDTRNDANDGVGWVISSDLFLPDYFL